MAAAVDQRDAIAAALRKFANQPIENASRDLFAALGYTSDRRLPITTTKDFRTQLDPGEKLTEREGKTLDQLTELHLLFQFTGAELDAHRDLLDDSAAVQPTKIESYLFFAADLPSGQYNRTALSMLVRAINKPLPMPALVLLRHGELLSIGIIHRRLHKRDASKDVLEKVTLIKDIAFDEPIRAHLEILNDFARDNLDTDFGVSNFVRLHEAWQKRLGSYALSNDFYREIADWYFWAHHQVEDGTIRLPKHCDTEEEKSLFLIRLLTRLIFCWFLIEKRLLPPDLFREKNLVAFLDNFTKNSPTYYKAILQNLFFGTLNMPVEQRGFREKKKANQRYDKNRGITNLWRYGALFRDYDKTKDESPAWMALAKKVPFLNGGLFDCLDDKTGKKPDNSVLDGFSDNPNESCHLPNDLFFGAERTVDLSKEYGEEAKRTARSKKAKVRGLIEILARYKFTIEENTPLEEEIALDPELLGKVFENLLASYNEDTRTTARKALGAFYTPREIVNYMVDEGLRSYLSTQVPAVPEKVLRDLFSAKATPPEIKPVQREALVAAIGRVKILDPACGSGAFPMGALHRLVDLLQKLDPNNESWKRDRLAEARRYRELLERAGADKDEIADCDNRIADIEKSFNTRFHALDFARKLYLIENSIYGVDIQPIATQIAKLRFFISLIVDQKVDSAAPNLGVRPLPNLETRLVAADALIPIETQSDLATGDLFSGDIDRLRGELARIRHEHFNARDPRQKAKWREADAGKREELADLLRTNHGMPKDAAKKLAMWDPYDQNEHAPFFDPGWMFGIPVGKVRLEGKSLATLRGNLALINEVGGQTELVANNALEIDSGFDVVIGNPPYSAKQSKETKALRLVYDWVEYKCDPYAFFIEAAHKFIQSRGNVALIVPLTWLTNVYYEKLRKQLIDGGLLRQVIVIEGLAFKSANVDTCLLFTSGAGRDSAKAFDWASSPPDLLNLHFQRRGYGSIQNEVRYDIVPKFDVLWERLRATVERDAEKLGSFSKISLGMKLAGNDRFVAQTKDRAHPDVIVFGDDVRLYAPVRPTRFFSFKAAEIIGGTKNPAVHRTNPKIFIQAIRNLSLERRIVATVDTAGYCFVGTVNAIIPIEHGWNVFLLLGLINSRLLNTYFRNRFTTISLTSAFLGELPIRRPKETSEETMLSSLAELIFNLNGYFAETTNSQTNRDPLMLAYFEQIVNGLVYELYFPDEIHGAGLHLFDLVGAANLPAPLETQRLPRLRQLFESLHDGTHPLKIALQKLQTLDTVRIIEGKA